MTVAVCSNLKHSDIHWHLDTITSSMHPILLAFYYISRFSPKYLTRVLYLFQRVDDSWTRLENSRSVGTSILTSERQSFPQNSRTPARWLILPSLLVVPSFPIMFEHVVVGIIPHGTNIWA